MLGSQRNDPTKEAKKLRVFQERKHCWHVVRPQWYNDGKRRWEDFKDDEDHVIQEKIPQAKFHGHEIIYLTSSRLDRATKKVTKWLNDWKDFFGSKVLIINEEQEKEPEGPVKKPKRNENRSIERMYHFAEALFELQKYEEAAETYEKLVSKYPGTRRAFNARFKAEEARRLERNHPSVVDD